MQTTQIKWPWFKRHFNFDFPAEKMPDIIERLRGTPVRAMQLVEGLSEKKLQRREGETWSIQENVAHIADLDPLWSGRVQDILDGHETMRDADLTNQTTSGANHHDASIKETLEGVRTQRTGLVDLLETLDVEQWSLS